MLQYFRSLSVNQISFLLCVSFFAMQCKSTETKNAESPLQGAPLLPDIDGDRVTDPAVIDAFLKSLGDGVNFAAGQDCDIENFYPQILVVSSRSNDDPADAPLNRIGIRAGSVGTTQHASNIQEHRVGIYKPIIPPIGQSDSGGETNLYNDVGTFTLWNTRQYGFLKGFKTTHEVIKFGADFQYATYEKFTDYMIGSDKKNICQYHRY